MIEMLDVHRKVWISTIQSSLPMGVCLTHTHTHTHTHRLTTASSFCDRPTLCLFCCTSHPISKPTSTSRGRGERKERWRDEGTKRGGEGKEKMEERVGKRETQPLSTKIIYTTSLHSRASCSVSLASMFWSTDGVC